MANREVEAYRSVALGDDPSYRKAANSRSGSEWKKFNEWDSAPYYVYNLLDRIRDSYASRAR